MRHVSHEHQDQLPLACTWGDATRDASGGATRTAPWKAGRVRTSPTPCPPSRRGSTTSLPRLRACHTGTAVAAVSPAARWGTTLSMRRQSRGRSWGNAAAGLRMPRSESPRCASSATTRRTSSVMPWLGSEHALATTKPAVARPYLGKRNQVLHGLGGQVGCCRGNPRHQRVCGWRPNVSPLEPRPEQPQRPRKSRGPWAQPGALANARHSGTATCLSGGSSGLPGYGGTGSPRATTRKSGCTLTSLRRASSSSDVPSATNASYLAHTYTNTNTNTYTYIRP